MARLGVRCVAAYRRVAVATGGQAMPLGRTAEMAARPPGLRKEVI
jgi:hypothetical protein